jgi:sortase A
MKIAGNFLAALSLIALGYWSFEVVRARLYQAQEIRRFANGRQTDEASLEDAAPRSGLHAAERSKGSAIAMLAIPRLGLSAIVVEGAEERELKLGPGHITGTSLPGAGGNVAIAGHRDTFFRPLRFIRRYDTIKLTTQGSEYLYKVITTTIVDPDDIKVLYPRDRETLTLVTCYPFNFVGSAPKRFVVIADRVHASE